MKRWRIHDGRAVCELHQVGERQRPLAHRIALGVASQLKRAVRLANPTLHAHGAPPAGWHVMRGHEPVADLYNVTRSGAKKIAAGIASVYRSTLTLLDNQGLPKYLADHGHEFVRPRRARRNPAGRPVKGEVWKTLQGGRCKVLEVAGRSVRVLHTETGNRETIPLADFLATYQPPRESGPRSNPGGPGGSLYDDAVMAGLEMDHHESDLYLRDTAEARRLVALYGLKSTTFTDNIDGNRWLEIPFAYLPFWRKRERNPKGRRSNPKGRKSSYRPPPPGFRMVAGMQGGKTVLTVVDPFGKVVGTRATRRAAVDLAWRTQHRLFPASRPAGGRTANRRRPNPVGDARPVRRKPRWPAPGDPVRLVGTRHTGVVLHWHLHQDNDAAKNRMVVVVHWRGWDPGRDGTRVSEVDPLELRRPDDPDDVRPNPVVHLRHVYYVEHRGGAWVVYRTTPSGRGKKVDVSTHRTYAAAEREWGRLSRLEQDRALRAAGRSNPTPRNVGRSRNRTRPNLRRAVRARSRAGTRSGRSRAGRRRGTTGARRPGTARARGNPRVPKVAARTFQMWHEFPPERVDYVNGPPREIPRTLVKLGRLRGVLYDSDKFAGGPDNPDGKTLLYEHKTKPPYPVLATDPEGRHVHIVGGTMKVTADGLQN